MHYKVAAYFQVTCVEIYPNQAIGIYRWSNGWTLWKIVVFHSTTP